MKAQKTADFVRCVEERSQENKAAFALLMQKGLVGPALALVRQELDSMIRVIWLIDSCSAAERSRLIEDALQGKHWQKKTTKGKRGGGASDLQYTCMNATERRSDRSRS